jgi:drug/metabolite transporter (DMT)-like permease
VTPGSLWGAVYLGLFSTFLCFSLQTTAQKFTGATHAAIILSLEAVFGSVLAVLLLKEGYNIMMIVGFVIIFLSVLMAELGENWIGRGSVND